MTAQVLVDQSVPEAASYLRSSGAASASGLVDRP